MVNGSSVSLSPGHVCTKAQPMVGGTAAGMRVCRQQRTQPLSPTTIPPPNQPVCEGGEGGERGGERGEERGEGEGRGERDNPNPRGGCTLGQAWVWAALPPSLGWEEKSIYSCLF